MNADLSDVLLLGAVLSVGRYAALLVTARLVGPAAQQTIFILCTSRLARTTITRVITYTITRSSRPNRPQYRSCESVCPSHTGSQLENNKVQNNKIGVKVPQGSFNRCAAWKVQYTTLSLGLCGRLVEQGLTSHSTQFRSFRRI